MELQQLRYFVGIGEQGSISGAASALNVTQSTISQAIQALERELGVALFHRVGRGMVLSSAGHALLGPARRILRQAAEARNYFRADSAPRNRLDISILSTTLNGPVSDLLSAFLAQQPEATVHVRDLGSEEQAVEVLVEGRSEIVCTKLPFVVGQRKDPLTSRLATVEIGRYEVHVAFPPGSPPRSDAPVDIADVRDVPMVLVPATTGTYPDLEEALNLGQRRMTPAAVVEQRETRIAYMLAGVGATFLGTRSARDARKLGAHVRELNPPFRHTIGLVFDPEQLSPAARAFLTLAESGSWRSAPAPAQPATVPPPGAPGRLPG